MISRYYRRLTPAGRRQARPGVYRAVVVTMLLALLVGNLTGSALSQDNPDAGTFANSLFLPAIQTNATDATSVSDIAADVMAADHVPGGHLVAVGPISGDTGFPVWYEDANSLRLELCLNSDTSPQPYCGFFPGDIPDPNAPLSVPDNFPEEAFWMLGGAGLGTNATGGDAVLTLALEAAFGGGVPKAGDQVSFGRIRIVLDDLVAGATYTATHPYGSEIFADVGAGKRGVVFVEDIGIGSPGDFSGALNSRVGPFLTWSTFSNDPTLPNLPNGLDAFIGDPALNNTVKGSPFGTNFFRVEGPAGSFTGSPDLCANPALGNDPVATDDCIETSLFSLMGKVATNSGVSANRATYSRSSADGGRINVWASSLPSQSINLVRSASYPTIAFDGNGRGRYFARVDFAGDPPLAATVRNASDVPATDKSIAIVDKVTITQADYDADADTLTIAAQSSDTYLNPLLTAAADGVVIGTLNGGALSVSGLDIAPELVTVTSAAGGFDTESVEVGGAGFAPAPLVAAIIVPDGEAVAPVTPSPEPDGATTLFTVQPYTAGASVVYLDGVLQVPGTNYSELDAVAGTIQFATAPPTGSTISTPQPPLTFNVAQGQTVTLNGASSGGDIDSYAWSQTGGAVAVALANASASIASFTAPAQETSMTFQLVVARNAPPAVDAQVVVINVVGVQPAVANAGPDQTVTPGTLVQLDGRGSTGAVSYAWTQLPGGAAAPLNGANTATPSFTFPIGSGPLTFRLTVTGADGGTATDDVIITAASDNLAVARAEYRTGKRQWRIDGTALLLGGNAITIYLGSDFSGPVIGTAQVDTTGAWAFNLSNSPTDPGAIRTVSVRSSRGGQVTGFTLTVRR